MGDRPAVPGPPGRSTPVDRRTTAPGRPVPRLHLAAHPAAVVELLRRCRAALVTAPRRVHLPDGLAHRRPGDGPDGLGDPVPTRRTPLAGHDRVDPRRHEPVLRPRRVHAALRTGRHVHRDGHRVHPGQICPVGLHPALRGVRRTARHRGDDPHAVAVLLARRGHRPDHRHRQAPSGAAPPPDRRSRRRGLPDRRGSRDGACAFRLLGVLQSRRNEPETHRGDDPAQPSVGGADRAGHPLPGRPGETVLALCGSRRGCHQVRPERNGSRARGTDQVHGRTEPGICMFPGPLRAGPRRRDRGDPCRTGQLPPERRPGDRDLLESTGRLRRGGYPQLRGPRRPVRTASGSRPHPPFLRWR